jgi:tetratricopeptide (TPR) repeat protein
MIRAAALIALLLASLTAHADHAADEQQARRFYDEGTRAFNLGEFARATQSYRRAYELKPDPAFLYNIAQSYRLAGNTEQALFFYRSYLRNAPQTPHGAEVDDRIQKLQQQLDAEHAKALAPPALSLAPSANVQPASDVTHKPSYKKWWFWTAIGGAVVVCTALGVGLGVGLSDGAPSTTLGTHKIF